MEYDTTAFCTLLQEFISDNANVKFHTCKSLVHVKYLTKQPPYKTSMIYAIPLYKRQNLPSSSIVNTLHKQYLSFILSNNNALSWQMEKKHILGYQIHMHELCQGLQDQ
jgi:hypothetical protein